MRILSSAAELPGFSGGAVACMIICIAGLLACLVLAIWRLQKRYRGDARELLYGAVFYTAFVFLGITLISSLFWLIPPVRAYGEQSPAFAAVIDTIANSMELPILLLVMSLRKKRSIVRYLEFGVGYGLVEMVIVGMYSVGMAFMLHVIFSSGGAEGMAVYVGAEDISAADLSGVADMMAIPWYLYLISAFEALLMAVFRIGMLQVILGMQTGRIRKGPAIAGLAAANFLIHLPSSLISREVTGAGVMDAALIALLIAGGAYVWLTARKGLLADWEEEKKAIEDARKKPAAAAQGIGEKVRYSGAFRKEKHATEHNPDQGF